MFARTCRSYLPWCAPSLLLTQRIRFYWQVVNGTFEAPALYGHIVRFSDTPASHFVPKPTFP
jgi:hypothetical protein